MLGPETRARSQAVKSLNAWSEKLNGYSSVTPTTNFVAFWQGILARSKHLPQTYRHLLTLRGAVPQESGKSDLQVYLMHQVFQIPISFSIEIKAFDGGTMPFDLLKDTQRKWVETRGGHDYWIWLWGYPVLSPEDWRNPRDRTLERTWLVPWSVWSWAETKVWDTARMKSVPIQDGVSARARAVLYENNLFVSTLFEEYELKTEKSMWWPSDKIREYLGWKD